MTTSQPLKILMVLDMPWERELGAPRVWLELAEEFRQLGHKVEKFDYCDAFPQPPSSRLAELTRPTIFSTKAIAFVKQNAHRFDVIDAHVGNLPISKQKLGIKGLLVARSVGLYALYEQFAKLQKTKWPTQKRGSLVGNLLRHWHRQQQASDYPYSLQACDLINLPNQDELAYVRDVIGLGDKCATFPFGLSQQRQAEFTQAAQCVSVRLARKQVAFIGSWGARKGSWDWSEIVARTRAVVPEASFLFLGTGSSSEAVLADLKLSACDWIQIIPRYASEELPGLLKGATVGAFPSYIEGFGFAVLEKLACGLPTVAYDVPGPREMLCHLGNAFMVPAGNVEQFSRQLVKLLQLDELNYIQLSQRCTEVAQIFSWHRIAKETLDVYAQLLEKKRI